jgi:signal peptidase II
MSESLDPGVSLAWRLLKYKWLVTISTAVLAVDQVTKAWIRARLPFNTYGEAAGTIPVVRGFFNIIHVENTGAALSLFTGMSGLLAVFAAATLVAIFIGRRALGLGVTYAQVCFGLLCGGIAGNLADRITHHKVIDFLDFYFGKHHYPTFNLADTAICIGVALYILSSLKSPRLVAS